MGHTIAALICSLMQVPFKVFVIDERLGNVTPNYFLEALKIISTSQNFSRFGCYLRLFFTAGGVMFF